MPDGKLMKPGILTLMIVLLVSTHLALIPAPLPSSEPKSLKPLTYRQLMRYPSQGFLLPEVLASPESGQSKWSINGLSNQTVEGRLYNVTLVTGDFVLVRVAENGTILSIAVNPADPTKLGQNFFILKMHNSTYVIPSGIDIRKFDLELFNIDLLIKDGYEELPFIPIIVEHSTDVGTLIEQLKAQGGNVTRSFSIAPAFATVLPKDKAGKISELFASSRDIRKVWLDRKLHSNLNESAPLIGAPDAWALGLNGSGVRIAIIDTGIDPSHEDFFFPNGTSKIERALSFVDYDGDGRPDEPPDDYFGHGTHVASIAAGTGAKSTSVKYAGIAPGATLWNVKVLNCYGWGYESWVIAGVEYAALGPDYEPNTGDEADVLSLSLGAYWWTDGTDPLSMACDAAVDFGRVVVVAAGNWPGYFHIGIPATARKPITVGATDKKDNLAWFSSCGPTIDFRVKPDIVAPGVGIWAACAKGSWIEYWANQTWIPGIDVDGDGRYDYVQLSGTSMSTPHISGVVALLKQLNPSLKPLEIKNILISTANDLGYDVYQQGGGRVNVTSSIDLPVLVDPATISFGVITVDELLNSTISFTFSPLVIPLNVENITLSLNVTLKDVVTGTTLDAASLNATTITIPLFESRTVLLTVNATVPKSLYEGKVIAKVVSGPWENRTLHSIFGFARLNNMTIMMLDRGGFPAAYRPIVIFRHKPTSYLDANLNFRFGWTDENGWMRAYVRDGEFYVVGLDWNYTIQADIWTIADRIPVFRNVRITLNESSAREVNFDPNRPNQVFCSKLTSVNYYQEEPFWYYLYCCSYWYYPRSSMTYMTSTMLNATFGYQYYPAQYLNPSAPDIIDTPLWHNLLYAELGVTTPKAIVANYTELVKIVSDYKVGLTPRVGAYIWPFLVTIKFPSCPYSTIWLMNAPQSRVEYMSPDTWDWPWYWKYRDPPWVSTPFWFFEEWRIYPPSTEVHEKWGQHPFQTWLDGGFWDDTLYLYGHVFMDSSIIPHSFYNWERYPAGHAKVWRNDTLIWEGDVGDSFWIELGGQTFPSKFKVAINGSSGQYLSTNSYYEYEFVRSGPGGYWFSMMPPVSIDGLDLNNTHAAGDVEGCILVDEYALELLRNITLEYSVDDGATWRSVPLVPSNITLPVTIAGKSMIMPGYRFTLANLSDVYVSLRVNATYTVDEIRQSQTTIRAFYVRPLVVITVGPLGSGADYTSISEALQVASPYSKIMVFPGIYLEGTLTIDKPLNITSTAGMNVTVVKGGTFNVRANNVVISGFTISEGSIGVSAFSVGNLILRSCNITSNTVGLLIIDSSVKIVGTEISENAREGVAAYGSNVELESSSIYNNGLPPSVAPAILLVGSSRACLDKSTIRDNTWGILQYDSSSSLLRRCDISNNNVGIVLLKSSCADVTYSCLHSNLWAIIAYSNSSLTVDSSTIYGNTYEGVVGYDASKVFLCSSSISNNGFNGMSMYDVSTLYLANSSVSGNIAGLILLDNSTACISISRVCNNTWGALAYNSSKLEAEDSAICANAFEGVVGFDSALIKSSGSLVADNTHNGVLMFGNSRLEAIDSRIQGSGAAGVYLCESSSALMKSSYSCNNTWGILGYEGTSLQIKGSHISYNVHEGIVLRGWSTLNMTGSTLTDNERGMVIYDLSMVTAGNSTMASNTYEGIVLYSNSSLQASYLNVSRNIRGISAYDMATVSAHHVIIALNTYEGIYIGGNATVALSNSSLTFNAWGMVVGIGSHATAHVHNSSIANNAEYGVLNWGMVPVNATYNWWGDPSGPYHPILNPSGAGDKVSDLVLFEPWLTSPPELWGISISGSIEYAGLTYGAGIVAKVHSGSLTGMDLLDAEAPPAPPEGLDMFFSIGDVKCLEDARPPATTIAWRFTVRTVNVKLVIP